MKTLLNKLPALHQYALLAVFMLVFIQSLLRLAFWLKFSIDGDPVTSNDLLYAFYLGMKFDMQVAVGAIIPVLLLGWTGHLHPVYSRFGRGFWLGYLTLAVLALFSVYALDFGHYAYLQQRINATALRFLENFSISATMVWETYPVISGSLVILLMTAAVMVIFNRLSQFIPRSVQRSRPWYLNGVLVLATIMIIFAGLMAKISWYPLRWSDAFFSPHNFSSQLASNPIIYFSNTLKNVEESYDLQAARDAYPLMAEYLGVERPDVDTLDFTRHYRFSHTSNQQNEKPVNVIAVFLESFASYKSGLSHNPLNTTPNLDRIADEGYFFKNYFTPTTGTARSVWTLVTGLPDIEKNKTSSRNPLVVDQRTVISAFDDHEKYYFLGGSASWANVRGIMSSNIPNLHIYEEGSYESPAIDVWGISDLDLFKEAHTVLNNLDKPFFAIIQTSGNHRPYTIPEDNDDFELWDESDLDHSVTDYGFASLEEMNSFRFMDHSIGRFMALAEKADYFDNTLFVFFGDHGIHAPTGKHVHKSDEQLALQGLRVPLVFYGKRFIKQPEVFATVSGEVDVLPTIAALTRTDYTNTTMGRDLLNPRFDRHRYAFTLQPDEPRVIGLISTDYYLQMKLDGSDARLQKLGSDTPRKDVSARHPETAATMKEYLMAMFKTIQYIRENNHQKEAE